MWIIKFTNDCQSYPVIFDGNKIAWSVFVSTPEETPFQTAI
jgi:hypothetical protein